MEIYTNSCAVVSIRDSISEELMSDFVKKELSGKYHNHTIDQSGNYLIKFYKHDWSRKVTKESLLSEVRVGMDSLVEFLYKKIVRLQSDVELK